MQGIRKRIDTLLAEGITPKTVEEAKRIAQALMDVGLKIPADLVFAIDINDEDGISILAYNKQHGYIAEVNNNGLFYLSRYCLRKKGEPCVFELKSFEDFESNLKDLINDK